MGIGDDAFSAVNKLNNSIQQSAQRIQAGRERVREAQDALLVIQEMDSLRQEIYKLRLHLACVVSLLIRSQAVSKETCGKYLASIDASDGVSDGMFNGTIESDGALKVVTDASDLNLRELAQTVREMNPEE